MNFPTTLHQVHRPQWKFNSSATYGYIIPRHVDFDVKERGTRSDDTIYIIALEYTSQLHRFSKDFRMDTRLCFFNFFKCLVVDGAGVSSRLSDSDCETFYSKAIVKRPSSVPRVTLPKSDVTLTVLNLIFSFSL